jgi:hypothetical protein
MIRFAEGVIVGILVMALGWTNCLNTVVNVVKQIQGAIQ